MNRMTGASYKHILVTALSAALAVMSWSYPTPSIAQSGGAPSATVAAIQGQGEVILEGMEEQKSLQSGDNVQAWNSITTSEKSRLYLKWDNGVATSLGDFSSIFLSPEQTPGGGAIDIFQIVGGIVRVATDQSKGVNAPFAVMTPVALIEPTNLDQPADFIVEVYDPSTTVLTVVAGDLRVRNIAGGEPREQAVSPCQTVFIDQQNGRLEVLPSSSDDVTRLIGQTTLPGTIVAAKDPCAVAAGVQPAPPPPRYPEPSPTYAYPSTPEYYIEGWDEFDYYPYEDITVLPPRPGVGCVIVVPGIGEYVIPLSVFGGWAYDPGVVVVWARRFFLERVVYYDWDYLRDLRARKRELHHLMYLAQLGRNSALLGQARNELDFLNLRTNWLNARLNRLERRVGGLQHQERQLASRLPKGLNLNNAIAGSFTSPANLPVANKLQQRLRTDLDVQTKLVNVAGNELVGLRSQLAKERDPQKRLALRNELARFSNDVAQGKLPISPKQTEVRNLVTQLSKEKDPGGQERIQKQLLGSLQKTEAGRMPEILDPSKFSSLKQDLAKFPSPDKRRDLENQVSQLQQSVEARKEGEANRQKAEELVGQAAREKNPEKQKELVGKLQELSTPLAIIGGAAAGAGAMKLLQQRQQHLEQQVAGEKDREKRTTLQQSLDELKKRQTDLQKQEGERKKPQELQQVPVPGREPQKQLELKKQEQLELRKKEEDKRPLRQQQLQQERDRQLQLRKQQQEDREKQLQQRRLEQEDRKKKLQIQKEQELLKRQQGPERLRLQQQEREKQLQQQRLQQQDREKLLQQRRLDQEQQKKTDQLKRQDQLQLQQQGERQQQLKLQQEKSRQEQLRLQQERGRQEQLKLQQEQSRQQQLRMQQERGSQQQLKQQQEQIRQQQLRQQQDQSRQQQLRIQQDQSRQQQIRQQQDQARQQQLKQQQEQLRLQKLKEEEEKKKLKK